MLAEDSRFSSDGTVVGSRRGGGAGHHPSSGPGGPRPDRTSHSSALAIESCGNPPRARARALGRPRAERCGAACVRVAGCAGIQKSATLHPCYTCPDSGHASPATSLTLPNAEPLAARSPTLGEPDNAPCRFPTLRQRARMPLRPASSRQRRPSLAPRSRADLLRWQPTLSTARSTRYSP